MQRRNFLMSLAATLPALKARAAGPQGKTQPIELAANGKTSYSICLSSHASPSEVHGAHELQNFLDQISGARLPIVTDAAGAKGNLVLVGNSRRAERLNLNVPLESLGEEGFMLRTAGKNVVIVGGRRRGTMYGVYTFLEKLGCRWFTRDFSHIPKLSRVTVEPLDEIQKPAFEYREPYFTEGMNRDWASRNKMNGGDMHLDAATGGASKYSPSSTSFYGLIPPSKYFKDHPEYFALVDGKRRGKDAQICLTNREVLRISIQKTLKWARENPQDMVYRIEQNDFWGWCDCKNCRRIEEENGGAHSGAIINFMNEIAAALAAKYPHKFIETLAYAYSIIPPTKTRPRANVMIQFCPIGACEAHPYERCRYDAYVMKYLKGWAAITPGRLVVWHYNANFSHPLRPYPDFGELAANVPMFRRHGVMGLFMQGWDAKGGGGEFAELRGYVEAKLLWNPRVNVKRVIEDFHRFYYGKASAPMLAYLNSLQHMVDFPPKGKGQHFWCCESPHFTDKFLAEAQELFRQAQAAAENKAIHARVEKTRMQLDYLELNRVKKFCVRGDWYEPDNMAEAQNRYQALVSRLERLGMTGIINGTDLDTMQFPRRVRPYHIHSLQNDSMTLHVAPELTGRIIQMLLKPGGENILRSPAPSNWNYPNLRGLGVFPNSDFIARNPMPVKWRVASTPAANECELVGTGSKGIRLRRRLQLVGGEPHLHTESTVQNTGTTNLEVTLQSTIEIDPGGPNPQDMDNVYVTFGNQNGKAIELKLIKPAEQPAASKIYRGSEQPDGELRVVNRRTGRTVINRFPKVQVAQCTLNWTAKNENRVTVSVWSEIRMLEPGQSLRLDADYWAQAKPHPQSNP